jgi:hypothetical protein
MTTEIAPNGSRWYYLGEHWEVVDQIRHDGQAAVACKLVTLTKGKRGVLHSFTLRQLDRALRTGRAARLDEEVQP